MQCPPTAIYIPNFVTFEEEARILTHIENSPKPKWTQLKNRRLLNYGGIPHPKGMISEEIPEWLQTYVNKINNMGIFDTKKANHVLVNEYLSGQGIMPHTDGPLFHSVISTISLGSHTILEFYRRNVVDSYDDDTSSSSEPALFNPKDCTHKLLLEPRSLLILKDDLYSEYLHSISEVEEDILCDKIVNFSNCENTYKLGDKLKRKTRVSMTIRHVPKTTKLKLKF